MRPVEKRVSSPQLFPATAAFALECSTRETSKSGVEKRYAGSVKKRWLTVESFTALLIEALREIFPPGQAHISCLDHLVCELFNVESPKGAYNFISRNHGIFYTGLALVLR